MAVTEILQPPQLLMPQVIPPAGPPVEILQVLGCFLKGIGVPLPFKNTLECLANRANSLEIPHIEYKLDLTAIVDEIHKLAELDWLCITVVGVDAR